MVAPKGRGRRRDLKGEEAALWRDFIRSITPLRRNVPAPAVALPEVRVAADSGLEVPPGATLLPIPAGPSSQPAPRAALPPLASLGRRFRQRIGRGGAAIDDRLDLHGMTQARAHAALGRFLRSAQAEGAKLVLVITGKGGPAGDAEDRGVLRRQVPLWLAGHEFRAYVVGFEPANIGHGGAGALYVRVRRRRA